MEMKRKKRLTVNFFLLPPSLFFPFAKASKISQAISISTPSLCESLDMQCSFLTFLYVNSYINFSNVKMMCVKFVQKKNG